MNPWTKQPSRSTEGRFERVYPQAPDVARDIDFIYRVQAEFPFLIMSGNAVVIQSSITNGP